MKPKPFAYCVEIDGTYSFYFDKMEAVGEIQSVKENNKETGKPSVSMSLFALYEKSKPKANYLSKYYKKLSKSKA